MDLDVLTCLEKKVVILRKGLNGHPEHSVEEVSLRLGIQKEVVVKSERSAENALHPSLTDRLKKRIAGR